MAASKHPNNLHALFSVVEDRIEKAVELITQFGIACKKQRINVLCEAQ